MDHQTKMEMIHCIALLSFSDRLCLILSGQVERWNVQDYMDRDALDR